MRHVTKMGFVQVVLGCALASACAGSPDKGPRGSKSFDAGFDAGFDAAVGAAADGGGRDAAVADASDAADAADASDAQSGKVELDAAADAGKDAGAPPAAFINPAPGSKLFLGANFWNIDWEGTENYFAASVNWATTTNPWNPAFLKDLAPYHVLRFMDWNLTNEEVNPQADWSTRKQPTADQSTSPVAYEWQIDLCNRTQKDYWINIPHTAQPEYMTKLATLIKQKLDPRLRVYLEWSNEVWNGGFPQREYAKSKGIELNLVGDDKGFAYQMYASVRTFEAFDAVFGKGNTRVVRVIAGQAANWGVCEHHIDALKNPVINPNGVKADVYAVAPYFTGATLDELNTVGIPDAASWITDTYRCAKLANLKVIAYEGGQDSYVPTGGAKPCANVQQLAGMRETYVTFLNAMQKAELTGPFMQYTHSGYCWGMKLNTSDTTEASPKYQGMLDWLSVQSARK